MDLILDSQPDSLLDSPTESGTPSVTDMLTSDLPESVDSLITTSCSEDGPEDERTLICAGGSDSGVEAGVGGLGGGDGYISGLESLTSIAGAVSTSCDSSLLSFSGDLECMLASLEDAPRASSAPGSATSSRGRRTTTTTPSSRLSPSAPQTAARTTPSATRRSEQKITPTSTKPVPPPRPARRTEARSSSRGRTPVSVDDGRWPSISKPRRSAGNSTPTTAATTPSERRTPRHPPLELRSTTFDKYATLPRRSRISPMTESAPCSLSLSIHKETPAATKAPSREPSLNRTASLRRQRVSSTTHSAGSSSGYRSDAEDASGSSVRSKSLTRSLPPYPRRRRSHNSRDAACQTIPQAPSAKDKRSREDLESHLRRLAEEHARLQAEAARGLQALQAERAHREKLQMEVERVAKRAAAMLRSDGSELPPREDWLSEVEARLQATSQVAARQQKELLQVQRVNRSLVEEVERAKSEALAASQQLMEAEEEAAELQDFLADEKSTLAESLREAEEKIASLLQQLEQKDEDIERQQEECRHLVRLSEQRRQEAAALQAQVSSSERLMVTQGGTTTAASVALSGLCSRLESLLPQISSPNKEEVEIFLNEAYAPSAEASPESQRRASATNSPGSSPGKSPIRSQNKKSPRDTSTTTVSKKVELSQEEELSKESCPIPPEEEVDEDEVIPHRLAGSASLHDLSQAILSCRSMSHEEAAPPSPCSSLVDQAMELDQLITKVLGSFQELQQHKCQCQTELQEYRRKFEIEVMARESAEKKLEEQKNHFHQLETAGRLLQQAGSETPTLREELIEKERQLAEVNAKSAASRQLLISNWRQTAEELRKQYEAVDRALETLHSVQSVVGATPALAQLQQELEEANFRCASLPALAGPLAPEDLNANAASEVLVPTSPALHMPEAVNGTA